MHGCLYCLRCWVELSKYLPLHGSPPHGHVLRGRTKAEINSFIHLCIAAPRLDFEATQKKLTPSALLAHLPQCQGISLTVIYKLHFSSELKKLGAEPNNMSLQRFWIQPLICIANGMLCGLRSALTCDRQRAINSCDKNRLSIWISLPPPPASR